MFRFNLAVSLSVVLAGAISGQPSVLVTEGDFLSILDDSHPAAVAVFEAEATARARVIAATTLANPRLSLVREGPAGSVKQTDWVLSWRLPDAGRGQTIKAREGDLAAARARVATDRWSLRLAMREVYAEWALAAARRDLLEARASRMEALAGREAARAEGGETSGLAARRLALAASALRGQATLAAAKNDLAGARVRTWSPGLSKHARPALPSMSPIAAPAVASRSLHGARAELTAAALERAAAARFLASPEVSLGWQRQEGESETLDGVIFGVSWSIPLFGRGQAHQATAEARFAGAEANLEIIRREVKFAGVAVVSTYRRLVVAVHDAEAAVAGHEGLLASAEAAFRLGESSLTDLLETLGAVGEAQAQILNLREAALSAHRKVEGLTAPPKTTERASQPNFPEEKTP